jgi:hypothetical protein
MLFYEQVYLNSQHTDIQELSSTFGNLIILLRVPSITYLSLDAGSGSSDRIFKGSDQLRS